MIGKKVAFVLQLTDDFSGKKIVKRKFFFSLDGHRNMPIEKEEGYFVFLEPVEEKAALVVEGSDYFRTCVTVEKNKLNPREPVFELRLFGKPGRSFDYPCELLPGRVREPPGGLPVQAAVKRERPTGLLFQKLWQQEDGTVLKFSGFSRENLIGRPMILPTEDETDCFILREKQGINKYKTDRIFRKIPKEDTPLVRIFRTLTDEQGYFTIPVEPGDVEQVEDVMTFQTDSSITKKGGLSCQF